MFELFFVMIEQQTKIIYHMTHVLKAIDYRCNLFRIATLL